MPGVVEFLERVREDESLCARLSAEPDSVMVIAAAEGFEFEREELVGRILAEAARMKAKAREGE